METRHRLSATTKRGFTLVELLVVMGVIAVLVGITFGAVSGAWNSSNKAAASSQIQALSTAIESYKVDNGIYPEADGLTDDTEPSGNPSDSEYLTSSRLLFRALTGIDPEDGSGNDTGSPDWGDRPNKAVYLPSLKKNMVQSGSGGAYFIDPWGFSYGYRSLDIYEDHDGDASTPRIPLTSGGYNLGFFDLWSTGGSSEDDSPAWIVNWQDPDLDRLIAK